MSLDYLRTLRYQGMPLNCCPRYLLLRTRRPGDPGLINNIGSPLLLCGTDDDRRSTRGLVVFKLKSPSARLSMIAGGEQGVLAPPVSRYDDGGGVLVGVRARP